jgi:hypothetical protein
MPFQSEIQSFASECAAPTLWEAHRKAAERACPNLGEHERCVGCDQAASRHAAVSKYHFAQILGDELLRASGDPAIYAVLTRIRARAFQRHPSQVPAAVLVPPQIHEPGVPA